ncbi:MAG: dynamin family protein [Anaerolinea sp.]|nr:dynamin family protein [Anaerolinea sp.]
MSVTMTHLQNNLQTAVTHLAQHPATAPLADRLNALQGRLTTGRFHLAVLGQFKRGKSTLLNAFLGEPLLPTGIVPVTAIPSLIVYGPTRQARIFFHEGAPKSVDLDQLAAYITEAANPHNQLGVARVEVQHPAPLLARGVALIDTPGIGSTLTHNTETTLDFLTEVDAALFLVSADPPLTAVELDFLQAVRQRVKRLFFLLNKVDYLTPDEQQESLRFLENTLRQQAALDGDLQIFPVSARLALEAQLRQDKNAWVDSGMAAVVARLEDFLQTEKQATLQTAIATKAGETIREALQLLHTERRALTMPLEELQQKRCAFQDALTAARRQRQQAADMLQGDQRRMVERINQLAAALRAEAERELWPVVATAVATTTNLDEAEELAQRRLADATETFFSARYAPFSQRLQTEVTTLFATYANQADALVNDLRRLAADLFVFEFVPLSPDEPPARLQTPYWTRSAIMGGLGLPISPNVWERMLPAATRKRRILNRVQPLVAALALRNTEHLRWAVVQNTQQALRQFQMHLDARWHETIEATAQVLETAVTQRQEHAAASAPSLAELDQFVDTLQTLAQALSGL